jgi:twinkle protein
MASVFDDDEIDFSIYLTETDAQQKVKPASMWVQQIVDQLRNPVKQPRTVMPWTKTHGLLQFRPGEVTLWGGANGNGKSLVTGQIGLSLCAQQAKVCVASFEMKPIKTLERMARQWSCFNPSDPVYRGNDVALDQFIDLYGQFGDWTDGKLWLYDQQGTVTADKVCAVVRYSAKELGVNHFFIDSLMKCVAGEDDYNGQKRFVDDLTAIARDHNIHIHLVHHIRKPADESHKPSKYDYKGTGAIVDQADNIISVWRNKAKERKRDEGKDIDPNEPDCLLICDKQRHGEWEGNIALWFDAASQQYVQAAGLDPVNLWKHPEEDGWTA